MNDKMKTIYTINEGKVCLALYRVFFQKEAVLAASQKMTGDFYVEIKSLDSERVGIYLEPKGNVSGASSINIETLEEAAKNFCNEVLDQQVRLDLENRYGKIRELIVRQAFSPVKVDKLSMDLES
jgi:His-Xaa-Ser system protein HxsD